ncbi:hypothetical protein NQ314_009456 [Rhamnusium bicolor]|uniref:Myb/SANT-like DNA-binding domain-containing protein n=1 Tax=Rhamnusium bicolor TaxID=1586634 RepID=A0AAV8XZJ2_9CUCU|nr:hypothetical protein NQ314_009456 [Rhamnusium bicolor]
MQDLNEFIIIHPAASTSAVPQPVVAVPEGTFYTVLEEDQKSDFKWNVNSTKMLIDAYKKYRNKVGTFEVRTMKQMWLIIAKYLSELLKTQISDSNCPNRWRVLDRNYKKYVGNQKSTGRGKKYFDYAEEMDGLFEKNKAVYPEFVL